MEYAYKKNNQHYVLTRNDQFIGAPLDEVALAFTAPIESGDCFVLHKHGSLDSVQRWVDQQRQKLKSSGLSGWSNEIVVIAGRFDIEYLNRVIDNSGYLPKFLAHHQIELQALPNALDSPETESGHQDDNILEYQGGLVP